MDMSSGRSGSGRDRIRKLPGVGSVLLRGRFQRGGMEAVREKRKAKQNTSRQEARRELLGHKAQKLRERQAHKRARNKKKKDEFESFVNRLESVPIWMNSDLIQFHAWVVSKNFTIENADYAISRSVAVELCLFLTPRHRYGESSDFWARRLVLVADIILNLINWRASFVLEMYRMGAINKVLDCLSWAQHEDFYSLCVKIVGTTCLHDCVARKLLDMEVIKLLCDKCSYWNINILSVVVWCFRNIVNISEKGQVRHVMPLLPFVARILSWCDSKIEQLEQMKQLNEWRQQKMTHGDANGMEIDESKISCPLQPETVTCVTCGDDEDLFDQSKHLEQLEKLRKDAIKLLAEAAQVFKEDFLFNLSIVPMPVKTNIKEKEAGQTAADTDELLQTHKMKHKHKDKNEYLYDYLFDIVLENMGLADDTRDDDICARVFALCLLFVADGRAALRDHVLTKSFYDAFDWYLYHSSVLRPLLWRLLNNIVAGTKFGDTNEAIEALVRNEKKLVEKALDCFKNRSKKESRMDAEEAGNFLVTWLRCTAMDVVNFVTSSDILTCVRDCLTSPMEWHKFWGVQILLEALHRMEKQSKEVLQAVVNVYQVNGIASFVNNVTAQSSDGKYSNQMAKDAVKLSDYF